MKITDLTPYRKHVDQFDLTEEQKLESNTENGS